MDFGDAFTDALTDVATFLPKLLGFLLILVLGWIVARVLQRVVDGLLERVGFDRYVERGGVKRALARTPYDASDFLAKLVYYAVLLFTLQLAFGVFGPNPISELIQGIIEYLPKVFVAIVIIVIAAAIAAAVREIVDAALGNLEYGPTLARIASVAILVIGVFAALDQLEIAPQIVNGLFYALLAVIVGVTIVAVGGGGIQPMRERWHDVLARYDDEKQRIAGELEDADERVAARTQQRREQLDPDHRGTSEAGPAAAEQRATTRRRGDQRRRSGSTAADEAVRRSSGPEPSREGTARIERPVTRPGDEQPPPPPTTS